MRKVATVEGRLVCLEVTPLWKCISGQVDLWNNLGFSLYITPFVCHIVATSDDGEKSEMEVSADWCVAVEH